MSDLPGNLARVCGVTEVERREITFSTDSLGYRNDWDYADQEIVLVGDSFVVGNGMTQSDTIVAQLLVRYGFLSYSAAFPGYVSDYSSYIDQMSKLSDGRARFVVFFFEGNDFREYRDDQNTKPLRSVKDRATGYLYSIPSFRFISVLRARVGESERVDLSRNCSRFEVADRPLFVLNRYAYHVAEREEFEGNPEHEAFLEQHADVIEHIFFVPTKYRVYHEFFDKAVIDTQYEAYMEKERRLSGALPHAQWEYLSSLAIRYGVSATDLTPDLIERSNTLIAENKTTFWRDDTHWNGYGVAVAVERLASELGLEPVLDGNTAAE